MNYRLVARLLGILIGVLSVAFGGCLVLAWFLDSVDQFEATSWAFEWPLVASFIVGSVLFWLGRGATRKFFQKEALCVIGLSWILASLLGAIPYWVVVPDAGLAGAFFESASGLTTTGASVLSDLEKLPPSLLFWRCLSQWIGGMGVVVFFVAIFGFLGVGAKMLYSNEASGSLVEADESRVQKTVLRIVLLYLAISVLCVLSYYAVGLSWFDAVCHMFATVSTGGFSTRSASIAAFHSSTVEWVAIFYMALCGVSFVLLLRGLKRNWEFIRKNSELWAYLTILVVFSLGIAGFLEATGNGSFEDGLIRTSTFQVVSVLTTTGFATEDFALWPAMPKIVLLLAMAIGGSTGSTAGGLKVARIVVVLKVCLRSIEKSFRRRVLRRVSLNGRALEQDYLEGIQVFVVLSGIALVVGLILVSVFEFSVSLDTNISAVLACYFNIGPGLEEVGPMGNYALYSPAVKVLLSILMIMGRLELYAVLALFSPSLWRSFR